VRFRSAVAALALAAVGLLAAPRAWSQGTPDPTLAAPPPSDSLAPPVLPAAAGVHGLRWYEPLIVLGGVGLLSTLDQPVANHVRDHRSGGGDNLADVWSRMGTPLVFGPVTVGLVAGGLIARNPEVTKAGGRLALALVLAGAADEGVKTVLGRERPIGNEGAFDFDPGHFDTAFPSGHTAMAFAMAASLADDVHPTWAKLGLYGLATGVAVSRVYQQQHWVSDVFGGAALGIASAKFASGKWRLLGIRAPTFLMSSGRPGLGYQFSFHE
jgi:membrane-associated phospholipid phosphatase